ncbi:MAG: GTP-binding protein [Planctomycetaceae bacterium]|nr:GTP-binding protein [Planctomycetaceae bacterium]
MARPSPLDTIAAFASPPGGAARAVLRISGPRVLELARGCLRDPLPAARGLLTTRFDPATGRGTWPALGLWMPGPRSYTGEDVLELHLPGAEALCALALERVVQLGARPAEPGEFTRRAFLNGRMDLTQAEGVADLVGAKNEGQRRAALRLLEGDLGRRVADLVEELLGLSALAEASLDFDEYDTGAVPRDELRAGLLRARAQLEAVRAQVAAGAPASGRVCAVLAGAPNGGKSSLFNALTGAAALVSPRAGTTRDRLEGTWRADGLAIELWDLPGLDDAAEGLDALAQDRARASLAGADLILWVASAADPRAARPPYLRELPPGAARILVWSQIDVPGARPEPPAELLGALGHPPVARVSALRGLGLDELSRATRARVGALPEVGGVSRETAGRHRMALDDAGGELEAAERVLDAEGPLDLFASHLVAAGRALEALGGSHTAEDVLDRIFARFCLGK